MDTVDSARRRMLSDVRTLPDEPVKLEQAWGRTLAQDLIAARDQPPFRSSAMDGYACRQADTGNSLRVVGESAAGSGFERRVEAGEAVRIFTGAPVPEGAEVVVVQEQARVAGSEVTLPVVEKLGANIRVRGVDFPAGEVLLAQGRRLDGRAMALAAAAGFAEVSVARLPRIAVLATGPEVVPPGATPGVYQIYDSVSFGLAGLLTQWGAKSFNVASRADDAEVIADAVESAFAEADLLVTVGGASVGKYDVVKPALERFGLALLVDKVAVRPGKPTWYGRTTRGPVLGLPGNPAAALVCAYLFLRPLIDAMTGRDAAEGVTPVRARLRGKLAANGSFESFSRAALSLSPEGVLEVTPADRQDTSLLSVFAGSDALIRRAPGDGAAAEGDLVDVLLLKA